MKKENIIEEIINTGSDISGSVGGGVIGGLIAGPLGVVIGGASGPVITKIFKTIGTEIKERHLSNREAMKIGAAYTFALKKIKDNELNGQSFRNDNFLNRQDGRRSGSEEILEGVLISSQREFEELKLKYLGNLYANICFRQDVSKEYASQLIKSINNLSYRQLCLLQLLRQKSIREHQLDFRIRGLDKWEIDQPDIIAEIRDLQQRGYVFIPTTFDGGNNSSPVKLETLKINPTGLFFCEMLSLEEIDENELIKLNDQTAILD